MKDSIVQLLKIKSIVTIVMTLLFAFLAVKGMIDGATVKDVFVMIISFYFGVQSVKEVRAEKKEDDA